jgi:hypothetical protein
MAAYDIRVSLRERLNQTVTHFAVGSGDQDGLSASSIVH